MHHHDHASHRIGWAFFLNVGFTIIEFIGGWLTNSTAIMADAVHDLGDSLSIGTSWLLAKVSQKDADPSFTYGYRRLSLFGALLNGIILMVGSFWVLTQAIPRLFDPVMPIAEGMLGLAVLGVLVNGFAAYRLNEGHTLNEKILNWHLLEDVLGWIAVLIVSTVLLFVDWPILDPLLSIGFTLFILINVTKNLWMTLKIFAQSAPDSKNRSEILLRLTSLEKIRDAHHLHIWSLDGEAHVLTAHLVLTENLDVAEQCELKRHVANVLKDFQLTHTTIELEYPDEACRDDSSGRVAD
jgi:cobalt-zinc-cadmium efflux system protein